LRFEGVTVTHLKYSNAVTTEDFRLLNQESATSGRTPALLPGRRPGCQLGLEQLQDQIDGWLVLGTPGHDDVCCGSGGIHESVVTGLDRLLVLIQNLGNMLSCHLQTKVGRCVQALKLGMSVHCECLLQGGPPLGMVRSGGIWL